MTPTLWDNWNPPSHSDPNSKAAAESVIGSMGSVRQNVAWYILAKSTGSQPEYASEEDVESFIGASGNTIRPRIVELREAGVIRRCEATGTTRSGRKCSLYEITELGRRLLRETET